MADSHENLNAEEKALILTTMHKRRLTVMNNRAQMSNAEKIEKCTHEASVIDRIFDKLKSDVSQTIDPKRFS